MSGETRFRVIEEIFQQEADEWHRLARLYQTRYDEMLADLVSRVRVGPGARILDLGCGSGVLAELVLERFPGSHATLLDLSSNMIEASRRRLARFDGRTTFVVGRFEEAPGGPYDAVVSTLALHHLGTDDEKRALYRRVLASLAPGGQFWQGEYVLSAAPEDSELNEEAWADWLREQGHTEEAVRDLRHRVAHNDRPAPLVEQLRWLHDLGYEHVDCTWRYTKFAVFGGRRSPADRTEEVRENRS